MAKFKVQVDETWDREVVEAVSLEIDRGQLFFWGESPVGLVKAYAPGAWRAVEPEKEVTDGSS